jgi:glycerol uptake facilitator-like aquaporin
VSIRLTAEALGTSTLVYVVVGSGVAAETLSADPGVQLVAHALAVGLGLAALIAMFQTVSGSHFNPAVTLAFWRTGEMGGGELVRYMTAQVFGAIVGVAAANGSFGERVIAIATTTREGVGQVIAETIATFVLVLIILALVRTTRSRAVVGAWVAAAVFATSSTGFANPAVTIARIFTDTYTRIAPGSAPSFLVAQLVAGLAAAVVALPLFSERVKETART